MVAGTLMLASRGDDRYGPPAHPVDVVAECGVTITNGDTGCVRMRR